VFCAVVEANEKDPASYSPASGLSGLLLEASRSTPPETPSDLLPLAFAKSAASILLSWRSKAREPQTVIFASVLAGDEIVHVCTAGDCRVHLIKDDEVLEVTRDHNAIDDPSEVVPFPEDDVLRQVYLRAITRTIGFETGGKEPETVSWVVDSPYSILICSSNVHRYRPPKEYVRLLMKPDFDANSLNALSPGLVITIS
jgi:serine/threonine protein phosphatase PrpC